MRNSEAPKPGERTAEFVRPFTHLHYGSDDSGWETLVAVGMPYEENGEFWVDARPEVGGDVFPAALHDAVLGI
jgi:hypothetical protein